MENHQTETYPMTRRPALWGRAGLLFLAAVLAVAPVHAGKSARASDAHGLHFGPNAACAGAEGGLKCLPDPTIT